MVLRSGPYLRGPISSTASLLQLLLTSCLQYIIFHWLLILLFQGGYDWSDLPVRPIFNGWRFCPPHTRNGKLLCFSSGQVYLDKLLTAAWKLARSFDIPKIIESCNEFGELAQQSGMHLLLFHKQLRRHRQRHRRMLLLSLLLAMQVDPMRKVHRDPKWSAMP